MFGFILRGSCVIVEQYIKKHATGTKKVNSMTSNDLH